MNKLELIHATVTHTNREDGDGTEAQIKRLNKPALIALLVEMEERTADEPKRSMAGTLGRYRTAYEPSIAAGGRKSFNCGDDLAGLLAGLEPEQVIKLAELALDLEVGTLQAKYDALNPGQKRMNAGNRIRAAIKRGDLELDAIKAKAGDVVGLEGLGN